MAAPAHYLPEWLPIRLSKMEEYTGTPAATMREAISKNELRAELKKGAWYLTFDEYTRWIEDGDEEKAEGRGNVRATSLGNVELLHPPSEQKDQGRTGGNQAGGKPQPPEKTRGGKKRRKASKRAIVYDLGESLG